MFDDVLKEVGIDGLPFGRLLDGLGSDGQNCPTFFLCAIRCDITP